MRIYLISWKPSNLCQIAFSALVAPLALGLACACLVTGAGCTAVHAQERALIDLDFRTRADVTGWQAAHDIASLSRETDGMMIHISGPDPYMHGPVWRFPDDSPLWIEMRWFSEQGGGGQVFYFQTAATEANSARFSVTAGQWVTVRVPLPALGVGYRLRIDPPGTGGTATLQSLKIWNRVTLAAPRWPTPSEPELGADPLTLRSGAVEFAHSRRHWDALRIRVNSMTMSCGNNRSTIGYLADGEVRWFHFDPSQPAQVVPGQGPDSDPELRVTAEVVDGDGGRWRFTRLYRAPAAADGEPGTIQVTTTVEVDRDRQLVYLPMLTLLPGLGSFGTGKNQGLFAGLEYLADEPSSSEADLRGPASQRQVPDTLKVTLPLMVIQAADRYVGLMWDPDAVPRFSALFDSPDRQFDSGGHLMGILFPGSDGVNREEGNLLPYGAEWLRAGTPLELRAAIIGGPGQSVVPALKQYVALNELPEVPVNVPTRQEYISLAAGGWLDSKIREGSLYRHAYWGDQFGPQPAADAAVFMEWLAGQTVSATRTDRLKSAAAAARARVAPDQYSFSGVSHVRPPAGSLVFGNVAANVATARRNGNALLGRFRPDGSVHYRAPAGGVDYGETHFAPDANGLTALVVGQLLRFAAFSGDPDLIDRSVRHLRALGKFRNTVPRGAQTWEVPLHTPDILASANLVHAYLTGYELTGDEAYLEEARYWAWTGVPFVYLRAPTTQPIGIYSAIPVYGATSWVAPVWIGLPVQWCAMVYADALRTLDRHSPPGDGIWRRLADGITAAGIQHTWPDSYPDHQGLLPDIFELPTLNRAGPAINPGTVQSGAIEFYGGPSLYQFRRFTGSGIMAHVPGRARVRVDQPDRLGMTIEPGFEGEYFVLLHRVPVDAEVTVDGKAHPVQKLDQEGSIVLRVNGNAVIEIADPASASAALLRVEPGSDRLVLELSIPRDPSGGWTLQRTPDLRRPWIDLSEFPSTAGRRIETVSIVAETEHQFFRLKARP